MFRKENRAGLYLTIAVHLVVIIILLSARIAFELKEENSFVLDFTKQEQLLREQEEARFKEDISNELDELLSGADRTTIRNVATDLSESGRKHLKDDRSVNPGQVYEEAKKLQEKLDASKRELLKEQGSDEVASHGEQKEKKEELYKGPSVISYSLGGRKALSLPVPVYKCVGGGDVYVAIVVNRKGYVVAASVITAASSTDKCLQDYAIKASKSSRFSASQSAPERDAGEIVYRFIAQ
ncbi:MAG: hypothetical protein PHP30_01335 [Bacteroidales bacterium]|nr:hypothetical protein [Bacteroidales bacterium]MDD3988730.1 hypothetical protein [Bacteroidales bacterium]MDD4639173.1 hypothetical protein [Bacteroidales bacterium]